MMRSSRILGISQAFARSNTNGPVTDIADDIKSCILFDVRSGRPSVDYSSAQPDARDVLWRV